VGGSDEADGLRESPVRSVSIDGEATVVALSGELDLYNAEEVRSALHEAADSAPRRLVVDLGLVEFVDSTTLGVFVEARRRLPNQNAFLLAAPGRDVRRSLEVSGLDRHFALYDSVDAALAARV
jgi:anti-sigma B factor antagonist